MKQRIVNVDEWRDAIAREMSPLNIYADGSDGFEVALHTRRTVQARLLKIFSTPQHFVRTPTQVSRFAEPCFSLAVQLHGQGYIAQSGNEGFLEPGDICLFDWTVPHTRAFESEFSMFTIMFPHRLVQIPPKVAARVCGSAISGSSGLGQVASTVLKALANEEINFNGAAGASVVHSAIQVARGAIIDTFDQISGVDPSDRPGLASDIRQYILGNLQDPDMSPDSVAGAHFISTRKLHKLFQEDGLSVAAWIREQRLARVCRDLEDPLLRQVPLHRIADRNGLGSATQFSRIFRSVYGCTPSEYRDQAQGTAPSLQANTVGSR